MTPTGGRDEGEEPTLAGHVQATIDVLTSLVRNLERPTATDLHAHLSRIGRTCPLEEIEKLLRSNPGRFQPVRQQETHLGGRRRGSVSPEAEPSVVPTRWIPTPDRPIERRGPFVHPLSTFAGADVKLPPLYPWQRDALETWTANDHRGIIEAVTGTGKTVVGLTAIREAFESGRKALIVVPTIELCEQWARQLRSTFPGAAIGSQGGGQKSALRSKDAVVGVVNSLREAVHYLPDAGALLIGDEVHRYATDGNADALAERFDWRLGLTATYERPDAGEATFLDPYFGGVVFQIGFERAIAEGVICHFKVALIGVQFSPYERFHYIKAEETLRSTRRWLVGHGKVAAQPFGVFLNQVNALANAGSSESQAMARRYLSAFADRKRLLAEAQGKGDTLASLTPAVHDADRAMLFTETKHAAEDAAVAFSNLGLRARSIHSGSSTLERRGVLRSFGNGEIQIVCAPRILEEGVDVPAADLGIVAAASSSHRQMVQRMGRVLRKKSDNRRARFAVLFVEDTIEDPLWGAHEVFLDDMTQSADQVRVFRFGASATELAAYLRPLDDD